MTDDRLTLLITPGPSGAAWRQAVSARAAEMGLPVFNVGPDGPPDGQPGVFFASDHRAFASATGHRSVLTDTTAVASLDPSMPATSDDLTARSHGLVEADAAARLGASVLNTARYQLTLPVLGLVERPEGERYLIHPLASASPLSMFETLPVAPGAEAAWAPHWFAFAPGAEPSDGGPWIDLTGRMRAIVYGPYIHLPAGRWRADVRFSVDPEKAHVPLLFEWGSGSEFCRIMTEVHHSGSYSISLDRIWPEAEAAQLRIWNAHPVFQGRMTFDHCRVVRIAEDDPSPPTPIDRIVTAGLI